MKKINVSTPDEMFKAIESVKGASKIWLLFTGAKDASGVSWCPDCVKAEPVIEKSINDIEATGKVKDGVLITINIPREEWKDRQNAYRTNKELQIRVVPTLLLHGQPKIRLEEEGCANSGLVDLFLEE